MKENPPRIPPYKTAAVVFLVVAAVVLAFVWLQFRGQLTPKTPLTMVAARAGLVMDPGSKVTYNGVEIGRVASISEIQRDGMPAAKFVLDVNPKYIKLIPANVDANIKATTVFGNKYVSLTSPKNPTPQRITPQHVIDARSVTTEFNTLFETLTSIAEKVDPVKLNLTLAAAAQALTGLGDKFGQSIVNGNAILDDINPQMPQIRHDIQQLAALGDTYANAAPDLFDSLNNAVITARTLHRQEAELDAALLAATGLGNTGEDIFRRGGPYLQRGVADLVPTAQLLDTYSPEIFCTIRNYYDEEPKAYETTGGGNGYALKTMTELTSGLGGILTLPGLTGTVATVGLLGLAGVVGGAPNPYVYPDNLPRVNARGGPGGAPGCWQPITHDLWPAPESGGGHRRQSRAVQPRRHRLTVRNRVCVGPSSRGQHDQPMKITGTAIKLGIVSLVLLLITVSIVVVFGQMRFNRTNSYTAEFSNASGLRDGQFVRASGVEIGKVKKVRLIDGGRRVQVDFDVDRSIPLYQSTTAQIRYLDLIGDRYLELKRGEGEGADRVLPPGGFIPLSRTSPALDLDALIGGFKPLFRALDPEKVNTIASAIITVFQGQGGTINDILDQTAQLTAHIAERDQAIGEVVKNLNIVLDTTVRHRKEFDQTVDNFEKLITGLENHADPLAAGTANISNAAGTVADLLADNRALLHKEINYLQALQQPLVDQT